MKKIILFLALSCAFSAFSQQLVSTVENAHGDNSNILLGNFSSSTITGDHRGAIWLDNDGKLKLRSVTGKGFAFRNYANTLDEIVIDGAGNMGIGTLTPRGKLNIDLPLHATTAAITIGGPNSGNINVPGGNSPGGYNIDFQTWRDVVQVQTGARIRAERINNFAPGNALIQSMDLVFSTSGGIDESTLTEKLRIRSDGFIGIGTNSPKYKLDVLGTIRAQEVLVNMGGADFVFEKDYRLMPLGELERFVNANKHLPEVASATDMHKNGSELGDLNSKLLQKIEELTLYVIRQEKKMQALEKKVQTLSKQKTKK